MAFGSNPMRLLRGAVAPWWLLLAALAGRAESASPLVSIELRPRVQVIQGAVSLGDIAYLTSNDLSALRRIMAIPMGHAPRPGSMIALEREAVARWVGVRGLIGGPQGSAPSLRWSGAAETVVESASQNLPGEAVATAAQSALQTWLGARRFKSQVQATSTPRDLVLPAGDPVLRVRPIADWVQPSRRMLVWVDIWVNDRFARATAVTFEVNAWAEVGVASMPLERDAPLDGILRQASIDQREVDLTTLQGRRPALLAQPGGEGLTADEPQRLRRPLNVGEVLLAENMRPSPAVTRGGWAHLIARSGGVSIESRVEVLQDGRPGEVVRVKVRGASSEVLARVTGPGQVEVQP